MIKKNLLSKINTIYFFINQREKNQEMFFMITIRVLKFDTILLTGLFHKAISQSGTLSCPWGFTEPESCSTNKDFLLAKKLGKVTEDPKVAYEFLKTIDAKKLIETEQKFLKTEAVSVILKFDYVYFNMKLYVYRYRSIENVGIKYFSLTLSLFAATKSNAERARETAHI